MLSDIDSDSDYIDIAEEPLDEEDVTAEEATKTGLAVAEEWILAG